ncbi:GDP-mannose 4,6-dehydratase [Larkinella arboricola]
MKTYLVTGGAGFIGSNLCEALLDKDPRSHIICLDNFDNFYHRSYKETNLINLKKSQRFTLVEGDIRDQKLVQQLFSTNQFDEVIHLAAKAGVRPSILAPNEYYDVNIIGTQNIIDAMVKFKVKRLIFASSSSVYGANTKVPFSEEDAVNVPISPYAATKRAGELICYVAHQLYNIEIACVRFFTVYGPRQRPEMAIHKFTRMIEEGTVLPAFGDGSTERDYTYVDDIIQGLIALSHSEFTYEIINLGESETTKLRDLISFIEDSLEIKAKIDWMPSQPGDVDRTFADISKASLRFGYKPKTKIKEGIKKFVEWYKVNNLELVK